MVTRITTMNRTCKQTRLVQAERSYASVTRTESRQPITSQNNQEPQKKMASPSPRLFMVGAIQELQYVMKGYKEKNGHNV